MKRRIPIWLFIIAAPALLAFRLVAKATGIDEPWATLIFVLLVPLVVQFVKFVADKKGKVIADYVAQGISFLIAGAYMLVTGGFAGLLLPIFPVWIGDAIGFVGGVLTWAAEWLILIITALGSIEVVYRIVLKAVMENAGFGTKEAVEKRKRFEATKTPRMARPR